jgi:limonene-1,2-epoxide hydrolase
VTRNRFLKLASIVPLLPRADAAERTAVETANLRVVTDFCGSFAGRDMTKISAFLAEDCAYRIMDTAPPARGKDAIERIRSYVERSTRIEFRILQSSVMGPVVINERVDSFDPAPPNSPYHLTGVFFVRGGKIAEWTDYIIRP